MTDQTKIYTQFVQTYAIALVPVSLFGIISARDQFSIFYTSYLILWGILVKNYWFNFKLPSMIDVNHKVRKINDKKSFFKNITVIPIILVVLLIGQLFTLFVEVVLTQIIKVDNFVLKTAISLIPLALNTILVKIITFIFDKAIDPKINYIITIWTSFTPLILTLFVYLPLGYKLNLNNHLATIQNRFENSYFYTNNMKVDPSEFKINQLRFMDQYKFFVVTNQAVSLVLDNILPKILKRDLTYIEPLELSAGYLNYVMNFGFVVVFSNVWSISPIISLLFTLINLYIDEYKIKKGKVTNKYSNEFNALVKTMYEIMNLFTVMSSLVQPALILMYRYTSIPDVGLTAISSKSWFTKSPINLDYSLVIAVAFTIEHLCFRLDKIVKKLCITKLSKETNRKPKEVEERDEKVEKLNDIAKTTSFQPPKVEVDNHDEPEIKKEISKPVVNVAKETKPVKIDDTPVSVTKPKSVKYPNVIPGDILADVTAEEPNLSIGATLPDVLPISNQSTKEEILATEPSTQKSVEKETPVKESVVNDIVPETSSSAMSSSIVASSVSSPPPTQETIRQKEQTSKNLGSGNHSHHSHRPGKVISSAVHKLESIRSSKHRNSIDSSASKLIEKKKKKKIFGLKI